jgi:hypothetical protein
MSRTKTRFVDRIAAFPDRQDAAVVLGFEVLERHESATRVEELVRIGGVRPVEGLLQEFLPPDAGVLEEASARSTR